MTEKKIRVYRFWFEGPLAEAYQCAHALVVPKKPYDVVLCEEYKAAMEGGAIIDYRPEPISKSPLFKDVMKK